jgi:hypothetical protein
VKITIHVLDVKKEWSYAFYPFLYAFVTWTGSAFSHLPTGVDVKNAVLVEIRTWNHPGPSL